MAMHVPSRDEHMPSRYEHFLMRQDRAMQEECRREFESGNEVELMVKYGGIPAINTLNCMLDSMNIGGFQKEAYKHTYARLLESLMVGHKATPILAIAVDCIALNYFDMYYHYRLYYTNMYKDVKIADSLDRRRNKASRRLHRAMREFADLIKTSIDNVQKTVDTLKLKVVGGDES